MDSLHDHAPPKRERPSALAGATGAGVSGKTINGKPILRRSPEATSFRIVREGQPDLSLTLRSRVRFTLLKLLAAGSRGVTAWDFPHGARVAHYVWKLRVAGISVETELEPQEGEAGGMHACYRLAPGVRIKAGAV